MRNSQADRALVSKATLCFTLVASLLGASNIASAETRIGPDKKTGVISYPIVLTQSDSYVLTADLNVPAGVDGIVVAPGVSAVINLSGHTISGPAVCGRYTNCYLYNGTAGIRAQHGSTVDVANGRVQGFTNVAVGSSGGDIAQVMAKNLSVMNSGRGLVAYTVMAENILAEDNSGSGISADRGSIVNSIATLNGTGIALSFGTVRGCAARANELGFLFQRTTNQDNTTFDNGTAVVGLGANSPGANNNYNN